MKRKMIKNHLIISLNHNAQTTNLHKNSLLFSPRKQNIKKIKKMAQRYLTESPPMELIWTKIIGSLFKPPVPSPFSEKKRSKFSDIIL